MSSCCEHEHGQHGQPTAAQERGRLHEVPEIRAAAWAGALLAAGFAAGRLLGGVVAELAYLPALAVGGWTFMPGALRRLGRGRLGVDTLMTAGALGAVALGQLGEAASLAFLFAISEGLEAYALARTRRGLRALLDLVPDSTTVRRDGNEQRVSPERLRPGDLMIVRPGERLATDGVIRRGRSALDLSAITGESVPVEHGPDDQVHAGAINGGGVLEVEVAAPVAESSLARIVRIVEEAQERKAASQRLAERIARPLVPAVFAAAGLVAIAGSVLGDPSVWVYRALVVLVAAAPCAFAISVPVTAVAGIGAATRSGLLIKGGAALEALERVRTVAIDKTGTLTRNAPAVVAVAAAAGHDRGDVLAVAAALERHSEHPLARAILDAHPDGSPADQVEAVAGQGLAGIVDGAPARLGRPGWVSTDGLADQVADLQERGATVVLVERGGQVLGAVAVRDELRPEAADAVARLRAAGIDQVVMVTGDNRRTASALGRAAGVDEVAAELLPEQKVQVVQRLQRTAPVAMVGDGVNDAPALAVAQVGIAMGAVGTDIAIETADVALMGDDLRLLSHTFAHARRTVRIMRQNLALSAAILLTLVPLAALGLVGLASAVAVHELAEVVVIANGVRAGRTPGLASPLHPTAGARARGADTEPRRAPAGSR